MDFKELLAEVGELNLKYEDLLRTSEWLERRSEILKNDDFYCNICGRSETMWHAGKLYSFDKSKYVDTVINGNRITADGPVISEKKIYLHVHHKFYVRGRLPWEYSDKELTTLCNWCHWTLHQTEEVKFFQEINHKLVELNYTLCKRCNGAGIFPQFSHIQAGICFACEGARFEQLIGKPKSNWIK
jgi:hypothetical protein